MGRKVRIDMVGLRYGRLVGLELVEIRGDRAHWLFECDCGQTAVINGSAVRSGKTSSCGCLHREISAARLTVHGHRAKKRHDPTYRAWQQIKTYCGDKASPRHGEFGGRGIAVSPVWAGDFEAFLSDMGERPAGMLLARLDADDDFRPGNCRWAPVRSRSARALEAHRARRAAFSPTEGGLDAETIAVLRRAS